METNDVVLDEEAILNNIKKMYSGNWKDVTDYYKVVTESVRFHSSVCDNAAYNGHLEILKYAHENGCPWNSWTCTRASQNGHLEALKYAHENGCPWNVLPCACAASNGHLEILYYLYDNKAPYATYLGIHPNCKEFFDTYGEYWKNGDFSLMHNLKPAKN